MTRSWLHIGPTFTPTRPLGNDDLVKLYARGLRDGMRTTPGAVDAFRARVNEERARCSPETRIFDVAIGLSNETLRMTWDEFEVWLDGSDDG